MGRKRSSRTSHFPQGQAVCFSVVQNAPSLPKVTQGLPIGHVSPPPRERAQRGTRPPRRAIPPLARPSRPAPQPLRRRTAPRGGRLCRGLARRLFTAGGVKRVSHTRPPTRSGAARASLLLRPRVAADCPREQLPRRGGGGVHGADPNHTNKNHDHNNNRNVGVAITRAHRCRAHL